MNNKNIFAYDVKNITCRPGISITNNYGYTIKDYGCAISAKNFFEKLKPQLSFSERFKVFYSKDTYVLVDTKCGLLAKVKKNKELINDIEIAVLYLILKGFIGLKTSKINKLISAIDKPIKGCLYELADRYDVVMYVNNGYSCKAIPKSTKRMVKCLIDNAECNGKEDSKCVLDKIVEKLKTKQEDKPKPSVFKDGEERPKLPEGFTYLDDDVKDYIFNDESTKNVTWEDDWGEEIIAKYLNEVMKK